MANQILKKAKCFIKRCAQPIAEHTEKRLNQEDSGEAEENKETAGISNSGDHHT